MPITVSCTSCNKPYTLAEALQGKTVRCKACSASFVVSAVPTSPAVDPDELLIEQARARVRALQGGRQVSATGTRAAAAAQNAAPSPVRAGAAPVSVDEVYEEVVEDFAPSRRGKLVKIASDLDGSPRPPRFPVAVMSVLGGMSLMSLFVLVGLALGTVVLVGKLGAMQERQKEARAAALTPRDLGDAVNMLKTNDAAKRTQALEFLKQQPMDAGRQEEVAQALDGVLKHAADDNQRLAVLKALDTWGISKNVPTVTGNLRSGNKDVRTDAMKFVGKFREKRCYDALSERLRNKDDRALATELLIAAGPEVETSIYPRFGLEEPDTMIAACKVLGAVGTMRSKQELDRVKGGALQPAVRPAVLEALAAIEMRARQK